MGDGRFCKVCGARPNERCPNRPPSVEVPTAKYKALADLAAAVAEHFDGTDAPLGMQARAALKLMEA